LTSATGASSGSPSAPKKSFCSNCTLAHQPPPAPSPPPPRLRPRPRRRGHWASCSLAGNAAPRPRAPARYTWKDSSPTMRVGPSARWLALELVLVLALELMLALELVLEAPSRAASSSRSRHLPRNARIGAPRLGCSLERHPGSSPAASCLPATGDVAEGATAEVATPVDAAPRKRRELR
jgi:hypothetical protein